MNAIVDHIQYQTTAIELAKDPELRDIYIDLASRKGFVDPVKWCHEPHLKGSEWGAKALITFFEMIERNCNGLVQFQKTTGFLLNNIFSFKEIRLTPKGLELAAQLEEARSRAV